MHADRAKEDDKKATQGVVLGPVLALVFLGLCMLRILGDAGSGLFDSHVRIAPLEQAIFSMRLGWRLAGFAGALVLVHLVLGLAAWCLAWLARRAWPAGKTGQRAWTCLFLVLAVIWVLAANAAWFPSSSLGYPYAALVGFSMAGISVFDALSFAMLAAVGATLAGFVWRNRRSLGLPRATIAWPAGAVVVLGTVASAYHPAVWTSAAAAPTQPNVILIGLDSVRADIGRETGPYSARALEGFLSKATVFEDTTTPLARTFAAWVSILTGRHPHTTGATVNLLPRDLIETGQTLPELLRDAGYRTVYGIDEVRFSNIDESYGFDRTVSPRIGSADFLIEFFGDIPLSNLLVNTRLGDRLFPELHGNRAAKTLYDPDTFVGDLERNLYFNAPTLLAVHLTLAHWPYTWAGSEPLARGTLDRDQFPALYQAALGRLDRQFADLMAMLQRKGALENAIVVVLSDHGESVGERSPLSDEDGHMAPMLGSTWVYGHGTDVFSDDQYKVLLAFRCYGETPLRLTPGQTIAAPASLEDIAPTLSEALGLTAEDRFDGRSLMIHLDGREPSDSKRPADRIRFLETEFNPPGVAVEQPLTASAIARASTSYRIDAETDRVEIRPEELSRILETRQYAAVLGDHRMAAVPARQAGRQHLVYVGPESPGPVWLDEPPSADGEPVQWRLWNALRERFALVASRPVVAISEDEPGTPESRPATGSF